MDWIVQRFYNGLDPTTRTMIDQGAGDTFMDLSPEEGQEIIEKIASNSRQWRKERSIVKRNNRYLCATEANDAFGALSKRFDTLLNTFESINANPLLKSNRITREFPTIL